MPDKCLSGICCMVLNAIFTYRSFYYRFDGYKK